MRVIFHDQSDDDDDDEERVIIEMSKMFGLFLERNNGNRIPYYSSIRFYWPTISAVIGVFRFYFD